MKIPPRSSFAPMAIIKYCAAAIPCSLLITSTISLFGITYATEVESLQQIDEHNPSLSSPQARSEEHEVEEVQHADRSSLPPGTGRPKDSVAQPVVSNTGNQPSPPKAGAARGRRAEGTER